MKVLKITPKRIKLLRQTRSANCGQTCVAMVAKTPIKEVEEVIGCKGAISSNQVIVGLKVLGVKCGSERLPISGKLPEKAIIIYEYKHAYKRIKGSHFIVKWGKKFYDPSYGKSDTPFTFEQRYWQRIYSYIKIYDR